MNAYQYVKKFENEIKKDFLVRVDVENFKIYSGKIDDEEVAYISLNKDETFICSIDEEEIHLTYVEKTGNYISENDTEILKKLIQRMKKVLRSNKIFKRGILFRGKHEKDDVLIYGNLLTGLNDGKSYIVYKDDDKGCIYHVPVVKRTIEQYTNHRDNLENRVFEGDFVILMNEDGDYYLQLVGFGEEEREYSPMMIGFKIVQGIELDLYFDDNKWQGKHAYLIQKYKIKVTENNGDDWIEYQVIGNKTENPELMELFKK